jgi:hypothetical protein
MCGDRCDDAFGDVDGAIVCGGCLGWYEQEPDPLIAEWIADQEAEEKLSQV